MWVDYFPVRSALSSKHFSPAVAGLFFCRSPRGYYRVALKASHDVGSRRVKSGLATMINIINHDPQYWRDLAQRKREMAERMHTEDARASFMNAADYYEQIARQVETITDELNEPDSLGG